MTGEGSSDAQTLMGKLPARVLALGKKHSIPVVLFAGRIANRDELLAAGFADAIDINSSMESAKTTHGGRHDNPLDPTVASARLRLAAYSYLDADGCGFGVVGKNQ